MINVGKFYYCKTPRSEKTKSLERIQVVSVADGKAMVKTVDNLVRSCETYVVSLDDIKTT